MEYSRNKKEQTMDTCNNLRATTWLCWVKEDDIQYNSTWHSQENKPMVMENRLEVGRVRGGCGKCVPIKGQHAGVSQGWRHVSVSSLWWLPQSTHVLEFIDYTHTPRQFYCTLKRNQTKILWRKTFLRGLSLLGLYKQWVYKLNQVRLTCLRLKRKPVTMWQKISA